MSDNHNLAASIALPQRSLIVTVGRIITAFSFFMVVFYSYMLLVLKDSGLRDATNSVLTYESALFIEEYQKNPEAQPPNAGSLKGFIGIENLPAEITAVFPPAERAAWYMREGGVYYRFTTDERYYSHHHLYASQLPNSNRELFMYYRLSMDRNNGNDIWKNVKQIALLGFVLVVAMLFFLRQFINRALQPIIDLSNWINRIKDDHAPERLPAGIADDEIGQLARNLYRALQRVNSHNEKERLFLRNASHELRTPIAIIRNTMDVIEYKYADAEPSLAPMLTRIRRASDTMKAVTEAILWLALDDYQAPGTSRTNLAAMLDEVIADNQNLLHDKSVRIRADYANLGTIEVEPALLHIALDNLVRNAFQHCGSGEIHITAPQPLIIEICNRRFDIDENTQGRSAATVTTGGFGLGLALVEKIAAKKRWHFEFKTEHERARVVLDLNVR